MKSPAELAKAVEVVGKKLPGPAFEAFKCVIAQRAEYRAALAVATETDPLSGDYPALVDEVDTQRGKLKSMVEKEALHLGKDMLTALATALAEWVD